MTQTTSTEYWKNRKKGLRGQGPKDDNQKFYPKGEKLTYLKNGVEVEWPNAEGSHLVNFGGKGFKKTNRREARAYQRPGHSPFTKKGRYLEVDTGEVNKKGEKIIKRVEKHKVNPHTYELPRDPAITNHTAHRQRQLERAGRNASRTE